MQKKILSPILLSLLMLAHCSSVPTDPEAGDSTTVTGNAVTGPTSAQTAPEDDAAEPEARNTRTDTSEEPVRYGNFTRDQLTRAIMNELSGQRGQIEPATRDYLELARETGDLNVIRRAAQFASAVGDSESLIQAGQLWVERRPDALEPHVMLSLQLLETGDFEAALEHMSRVIELGGNVDFARLAARAAGVDQGRRDRITEAVRQLRDRWPGEESLHFALIQLLGQSGQGEEALLELEKFRDQAGESPQTALAEARLLHSLDRADEAEESLRTAVEEDPGNRELRSSYARLLAENNRLESAIEQFRQLLEDHPRDYESLFSMALLLVETDSLEDARPLFNQLINVNHRRNDSRFYLGYINEAQGDLDSAVAWYRDVQPGSGNFLQAQRQATELLVAQNELGRARQWLSRLSQGQPRLEVILTTIEADALINHGYMDEARQRLDAAVERYPEDIDLRFARSIVSERNGNLELLEQDLRRILEIDPENSRALNHLGYALTTRTERYDEARQLIERAIALEPDDPAIIDSLGWVQFKQGEHEQARDNLQRALEAFPDAEVAAHLGEVLWAMGERGEARRVWEEALERQPDNNILQEVIERLDAETDSRAGPQATTLP